MANEIKVSESTLRLVRCKMLLEEVFGNVESVIPADANGEGKLERFYSLYADLSREIDGLIGSHVGAVMMDTNFKEL